MYRRPKAKKKAFVAILAHNEAFNIRHALEEAKKLRDAKIVHDIVVVDDGSNDRTSDIVRFEGGVHLARHKTNQGMRRAFVTAVNEVHRRGGDMMVLMDGDTMAFPRGSASSAIRHIESGKKDMLAFKAMERKGDSFEQIKSPNFVGPRVINMRALRPLIKGDRRWISLLTNNDVPRDILTKAARSIAFLPSPESCIDIDTGRFSENHENLGIHRWGLPTALGLLIPNSSKRMDYPIYHKGAYRGFISNERGKLLQRYADDFVRGLDKKEAR